MKFVFTAPKKRDGQAARVVFRADKETIFVETPTGRELRIGVGENSLTKRKLTLLLRRVITSAKGAKAKTLLLDAAPLEALSKDVGGDDLGELLATAFLMANFEFNNLKTEPKDGWTSVDTVIIEGASSAFKKGVARGESIGKEVNATRILANTPGGDMTPKLLAKAAREGAKGTNIAIKVLGRGEMQKIGMGAILGVAKGSTEEPQFITLEYRGGKKTEKPIILVGKGVTFDTGGLNLKSEQGIYEMHLDMSGGAAVIHSVILAAKLKVKRNVIGLVPAVENMPSGSAYRPGDILKSLSGKTIEVLNTDAEGRIILADALTYAKRYNPALVIDVATLTGAALVALGQQASAILTRDERLAAIVEDAGEASGDYVWPLPLWDEYEDMVKGHFGDVANISTQGNSRYGGVISGAMFLWQFAKELRAPWVHIDMASRMTAAPGEHLAKGATGAPVRLLLRLIESYEPR